MKLRIQWNSVLENIMGEKNNQWWGWGPDKEISGSFPDYLSLMLGKPRIRLNNLKTSLRFPCLGLNPIIDSINLCLCFSVFWSECIWVLLALAFGRLQLSYKYILIGMYRYACEIFWNFIILSLVECAHFQGNQLCYFIFASPLNGGQLL